VTIREIQRAREKLAREIRRLIEATETLQAQDILLAAMETELQRRALQSGDDRSKMPSKVQLQNAATAKKSTKISARLTVNETEPRRLLLLADKTPQDIATELGRARSTVQAWLDGRNGIPKDARDHMRTKYGIPDAAWANRQD